MIILNGDTQKLQAVLAGAVNSDQPEFQATFGQLDDGVLDNYDTNTGELNSTTDVDIVAGVASKQLGIKTVNIFNRDDASVTITFKIDISATDRFIYRVVLAQGESVHYESNRGWYVCNANGTERSAAVDSLNVTNWDTAYSWGNHDSVGYLTSQTSHADVLVDGDIGGSVMAYDSTMLVDADIGGSVLAYSASVVYDADFSSNGILKRTAAGAYGIITDNSANWQTAYGWGDHSSANYLADTAAFGIQLFLVAGVDYTFTVDLDAAFAYTIVKAVAETTSGTITMAVKINGTDVTGISAMAITSTESTDTASAANSVSAGDKVTLVFSSNSSAVDVSVLINCTRS